MKIKELLYETPEMTEEKLLEIIEEELDSLKKINQHLIKRVEEIHKYSDNIGNLIIKEFDLIQDKKSYLTKSERELLAGFVGACMIKMVKGNVGTDSDNSGISTSSESTSQD